MVFLQASMDSTEGNRYAFTFPRIFASDRGLEYFILATDEDGASMREPSEGVRSIPIFVPDSGIRKREKQPDGSTPNA